MRLHEPNYEVNQGAEKETVARGLDQGASAYLVKPFTSAELLSVIEDLL